MLLCDVLFCVVPSRALPCRAMPCSVRHRAAPRSAEPCRAVLCSWQLKATDPFWLRDETSALAAGESPVVVSDLGFKTSKTWKHVRLFEETSIAAVFQKLRIRPRDLQNRVRGVESFRDHYFRASGMPWGSVFMPFFVFLSCDLQMSEAPLLGKFQPLSMLRNCRKDDLLYFLLVFHKEP